MLTYYSIFLVTAADQALSTVSSGPLIGGAAAGASIALLCILLLIAVVLVVLFTRRGEISIEHT